MIARIFSYILVSVIHFLLFAEILVRYNCFGFSLAYHCVINAFDADHLSSWSEHADIH